MVFHLSLNDSKFPQVSRTLLSILAVLNNAVVWMVSSRLPTSKSSSPFNNLLVTVPKVPITIGIIIIIIIIKRNLLEKILTSALNNLTRVDITAKPTKQPTKSNNTKPFTWIHLFYSSLAMGKIVGQTSTTTSQGKGKLWIQTSWIDISGFYFLLFLVESKRIILGLYHQLRNKFLGYSVYKKINILFLKCWGGLPISGWHYKWSPF